MLEYRVNVSYSIILSSPDGLDELVGALVLVVVLLSVEVGRIIYPGA